MNLLSTTWYDKSVNILLKFIIKLHRNNVINEIKCQNNVEGWRELPNNILIRNYVCYR
jgi:hypothetical protein